MTGKQRFSATLAGTPRDRLALMPITRSYAAEIAGVRYADYARHHSVLVEAQLRTAEKFDFDHVSATSDSAREASDLGAAVAWFHHQPPAVSEENPLLADKAALRRLAIPDPGSAPRMSDCLKAVAALTVRTAGQVAVEGWVEGPCTMAANLRSINALMLDFFDDAVFAADLFDFVVEMGIHFARAQISAGAHLIGVGDAACSLVGPRIYETFVLPYQQQLVHAIHGGGAAVRLHISGNTRPILAAMGSTGADVIHLDHPAPVAEARAAMRDTQVLSGNLDPLRILRDATPEAIIEAAAACHAAAGEAYILGAGAEIASGTPPENVFALARYARTQQ